MDLQTTESVITKALALMDQTTAPEIAKLAGTGTDGRVVREIIKSARQRFAERAEKYADLHYLAAGLAAADGDAGPAQWALERIVEEGQRIVDSPKAAPMGPRLQIGIAVGGIPPQSGVGVVELPPLDGETATDE